MSAVIDAIGDAVDFVADTVGDVVQGALKDPIGTVAKIAAVATQQYYLLPAISAASVVANGGDLGDAVKAGAITYAAGQIGGWAGDQVSTASTYATDLASQQTAMLAAQNAGMGMGTTLGGAVGSVAGGATGALLSGGNVSNAITGALAGYGANLGMNLGLNAAGQVVNQVGDVIADSFGELQGWMADTTADQPGDYPLNMDELQAADLELGGIPSPGMLGDQPGDYDVTPEDVAASEEALAALPGLGENVDTADQPGDYPTTPEDLALEDELMGQIGDQPGDYDQEGSYGDPLAEGVSDATQNLLDNNALVEAGGVPLDTADQPGDYDTTEEEMAASEEALAAIPDAPSADIDTTAIEDYFKNQLKNSFIRNLFGTSGGSLSGVTKPAAATGLLTGLGSVLNREEEDSEDTPVTSAPAPELGLFDPTQNMSWAPLTKIGGLGESGKYVNQEQNTYYVNPEQAKKEKENQDVDFGWDIGYEEPADVSGYYDYKPTDFSEPTYNQEYFADGGMVPGHNPQFFSEGGLGNRYVKGEGDGTSDSVPAMLASGEFVIPADVVSGLGNGDNDAGAQVLDEFMAAIRKHKRAANPKQLPEDSKGPLAYLQEALTKVRK